LTDFRSSTTFSPLICAGYGVMRVRAGRRERRAADLGSACAAAGPGRPVQAAWEAAAGRGPAPREATKAGQKKVLTGGAIRSKVTAVGNVIQPRRLSPLEIG
jgi:hypothetical protein